MKKNYTVSFVQDEVAQCRLVKAESSEQALAYFAEIEPAAKICGADIDQCNLERRGCPAEIVPDGWTPAPAQPEAEQEAEEKTAAQDITTKYYTPSAHISIFLNTWGNYNENGADGGLWISLPCDIEDMLQRLAESTGEDADEMEPFINDSETDIDELEIGELDDIRGLNDLAEQLDELDEWELEQLAAYMEAEGGTLENALENYEDCAFYEGSRLIDVAYELADEMLADAPEFCQNYFDYEAFARDLGFDGYRETSRGVICTR